MALDSTLAPAPPMVVNAPGITPAFLPRGGLVWRAECKSAAFRAEAQDEVDGTLGAKRQ